MSLSAHDISIRLAQPLPGEAAHQKLSTSLRKQSPAQNPGLYQPNASTRDSAVMIMLYQKHDTWCFPLMIRQDFGAHSGQISLPGGRREPEDPDFAHTALRETHEEIGIPPSQIKVLGTLSPLFVAASNNMVYPYVGVFLGSDTSNTPLFIPSAREVKSIIEVELAQLQQTPVQMVRLNPKPRLFLNAPYFDVQNNIVWGATAMILNEFLEMIA